VDFNDQDDEHNKQHIHILLAVVVMSSALGLVCGILSALLLLFGMNII